MSSYVKHIWKKKELSQKLQDLWPHSCQHQTEVICLINVDGTDWAGTIDPLLLPTIERTTKMSIYKDLSHTHDFWEEFRTQVLLPMLTSKGSCGTGVPDPECVCSSLDIFNFGCPTARGKKCRSK